MAFIKKAFRRKPEDPKKWLFVMKQQIRDRQTHEKGIACAVNNMENNNTGGQQIFLLTCKSVTNQQDNNSTVLSAHNSGSREPIPILDPSEDDTFSFTPISGIPKGCTCLLLKSLSDTKDNCRSFIIDGSSFKTVFWRYVDEENGHELQDRQDLTADKAVGSPVLWTEPDTRIPYVVGVICRSQTDGRLRPKFFTESNLQTPVVPIPIKLKDLDRKVKNDSITLRWNPSQDKGEPIQKYTVYKRIDDKDDDVEDGAVAEWEELTTINDVTICEYKVDNLERGKNYEFVVTATNVHGEGLKKNIAPVKVLTAVPNPVALKELPEEVEHDDFIVLRWTAPKSNGAPITHYTPYYRIVTTDGKLGKWVKAKPVTHLSDTVLEERVKLDRGKAYEIVVTASNSRGESLKENIRKVTMLDVPEQVKLNALPVKIDRDKIDLKWKKPESNGADITNYTVYKRIVTFQKEESEWEQIATTRVEEYNIDLERGKTYEICITATNKCGEGRKEAKFQRVRVLEAAPKPVKLLDVPPKIDKCDLILKWKETQNNGAAITKYTVYQRTVTENGTVPSEWKNIHSSLVYTYHVFNLERGKCYEFKVTATNKNGQGMEENIVRVKVKEDVPMPVELVDIPAETNIGEITLKWRTPQNNGAAITKYTIYKRTVNESSTELAWKKIPVNSGSVCSYNIKLEKGKKYEFKVTATNKCGEGLTRKAEDIKSVMVLDAPMPVELIDVPNVLHSSRIALKWKEPINNGAPIIGYMVYQRTVGEDGTTSDWKFIANTQELKCLITLERGMTFDFIVTAKNKCGEGIKKDCNSKRVVVSEDQLENFGFLLLILLGILAILWYFLSAGP